MKRLLLALVACSSSAPEPDYLPMKATALHAILASPESASELESVRIEPEVDGGNALYLVRVKTTARKRGVVAEFPGPLVDELFAAGVLYNVKPAGVANEERAKEIDAGSLRTLLAGREAAADIQEIHAKPTGRGAARYLLIKKSSTVPDVVFAEYPGTIVPAIQAAGIRYITE
ncbi:MAG: hypothetical protein ABI867_07110 [Kofleriaceae bacterium]